MNVKEVPRYIMLRKESCFIGDKLSVEQLFIMATCEI